MGGGNPGRKSTFLNMCYLLGGVAASVSHNGCLFFQNPFRDSCLMTWPWLSGNSNLANHLNHRSVYWWGEMSGQWLVQSMVFWNQCGLLPLSPRGNPRQPEGLCVSAQASPPEILIALGLKFLCLLVLKKQESPNESWKLRTKCLTGEFSVMLVDTLAGEREEEILIFHEYKHHLLIKNKRKESFESLRASRKHWLRILGNACR